MAYDEFGNWIEETPGIPAPDVREEPGGLPQRGDLPLPVPRGARAFGEGLQGLTPPEPVGLPGGPEEVIPPGTRTGDKFSLGTTGLTDRGIKQTQKLGGFAGVDNWTEQQMAPQRSIAERTAAELDRIAQEEKASHESYGKAESDYHAGLAELRQRQVDVEETAAHLEEVAMHESKIEREQYLSAYRQQLAGVKQLIAMDANPLHGLSKGGVLGLGAAAFAQGFLGAQGININVTGQIDQWVDREIAVHQQKIQNAKSMADEQLSLYSIARQSSKDDAEAREKLRGFIAEGFKQRILMEGDRFQSEAARSRAREKAAQLDKELAISLQRLGDSYFEQRNRTRSERVKELADQGRLAIDGARLSLEKDREKRIKLENEEKKRREILGNVIYDTSTTSLVPKVDPQTGKPMVGADGKPVMEEKGGGGKARWIYKDGVSDKEKSDYRAAQAHTNHLQDLMSEYRSLYNKYGNASITDIGRLSGTDAARMRAVQNEILSSYALQMSGKAVTDKEIERLKTAIPEAVFGTQARVDEIVSQTYKHWTSKLDKQRYEIADEIPEGHALRNLRTDNRTHYNEAGYLENAANSLGSNSPSETNTSIAVQAMTRPDAGKSASSGLYEKLKLDPVEVENAQVQYLQSRGAKVDPLKDTDYERGYKAAPAWMAGAVAMVRDAKTGDPQAKAQVDRWLSRDITKEFVESGVNGEGGMDPSQKTTLSEQQNFVRWLIKRK